MVRFGQDGVSYTIKGEERRTRKNETPGPGSYAHEKADYLTKPKGMDSDFINRVGRQPDHFNPRNGPGSQEEHRQFGAHLNQITIGAKR